MINPMSNESNNPDKYPIDQCLLEVFSLAALFGVLFLWACVL